MQEAGEQSRHSLSKIGRKDRVEVAMSARRLGATLWENNGAPSPKLIKNKDLELNKEKRRREKSSLTRSLTVPPHLSDPSHTPVSQRIDRPKIGRHQRRMSTTSQKLQLVDYSCVGFDPARNGHMIEIETQPRVQTLWRHGLGIKTRLKDVRNGLVTSKELLKVLNHTWGVKDYRSSIASLLTALRLELDQAHCQINLLIQEQSGLNQNKTSNYIKQFAEENAASKSQERERRHEIVSSMAAHVEVEKKMRTQAERLNKKLGKELADKQSTLVMALKELESEKRAREVLEQACDELARGIGEDRAEVEELKRESAQVQEELEREREMLQIADTLREERVQMKLSEAKYAAVERLRSKLEGYLINKVGKEKEDDSPELSEIEELREFLQNVDIENHNTELDEFEDSGDSDLHSIELGMEKNNQSNEWSIDSRRSSTEAFKGRKSLFEKVQWGSISLNRGITDEKDWIEKGTLPDFVSRARKNNEDDFQRYRPMKCVRDQLLPTSRLPPIRGFSSPTKQWGESSTTGD